MSYKEVINNLIGKTDLYLVGRKIDDEGVKSIAQSLIGTQISDLNLGNNDIGWAGVICLAEVLKDTQISRLNLSANHIGDTGVMRLAEVLKDTQIFELDLSINKIGFDGAQFLNQVLDDTKIRTLDLHVNFTRAGFTPLISQRTSCLDTKQTCITLYDTKIGTNGARYINHTFKNTPIELNLVYEELEADDTQYLFQAFLGVKISKLNLERSYFMQATGVQYLVQAFKGSQIVQLDLVGETLGATGAKYLAEFLREVNIFDLDMTSNYIGDEGVKHLAPALKMNTIMYLKLTWNDITADGAKYLADILSDTQIIHIDLSHDRIGVDGARYLAYGLINSQVADINLVRNFINYEGYQYLVNVVDNTNLFTANLYGNCIEGGLLERGTNVRLAWSHILPRNTTSIAFETRHAFKALVSLNPYSNDFEFNAPIYKYPDTPIGVDQYVFLIKTLRDCPKVRAHVYDLMCKEEGGSFDLNIMNKINEFIGSIEDKFNTFINDKLPDLFQSCGSCNYTRVVQQFEEAGYCGVVRNLLLHSVVLSRRESGDTASVHL